MKTIKPSIVIFAEKKEEIAYQNLDEDDQLKKAIDKAIKGIKEDAFYGECISKKLIPKSYIQKYEITNLQWVGLTKEARLVYSITTPNKVEILSIIIEIFDNHKGYEKRFKY